MTKTEGAEQKILNAARVVFTQKGMAGARMQEIANEAGINKALLHYYFRSKDKLFERIFEESLEKISGKLIEGLSGNYSIFEKIDRFIDGYISVMIENPYLPMFVLNEMNQNPERMKKMLNDKEVYQIMVDFFMQLMAEINNGKIRPIHPSHLILNLMGMIIFPFAARPIAESVMKEKIGLDYGALLAERKKAISEFVYNALKIEAHEK